MTAIQAADQYGLSAAKHHGNRGKNRYRDIIPCMGLCFLGFRREIRDEAEHVRLDDHARVVLQDGEDGDYINASLIRV